MTPSSCAQASKTSSSLRPDELRARRRRRLGVGADDVVVSLIGRFHPQKGQDRFVQALALLRAQGCRSTASSSVASVPGQHERFETDVMRSLPGTGLRMPSRASTTWTSLGSICWPPTSTSTPAFARTCRSAFSRRRAQHEPSSPSRAAERPRSLRTGCRACSWTRRIPSVAGSRHPPPCREPPLRSVWACGTQPLRGSLHGRENGRRAPDRDVGASLVGRARPLTA